MAVNDLYIQDLTGFLRKARRAASTAIDERTNKYQTLESITDPQRYQKLKYNIQSGIFEDIKTVLNKQALDRKRPEIIQWAQATESELFKFRMAREGQIIQERGKRFDKDTIDRKLSLRFKSFTDQETHEFVNPDIPVDYHVRDQDLIDLIKEDPEKYLADEMLNDEELQEDFRVTYSINKSQFRRKGTDTPYLELWTRTNTNSQRKLNKIAAYILGMRHDIPNDFAGSKHIVRESKELYQVRDELTDLVDEDLWFDYKGKNQHGQELPREYDQDFMEKHLSRAQYLDSKYTTQLKRGEDTEIPKNHKDEMLFGIWADFKYHGVPMESQILMRSVHERMERGVLSHSENYEQNRHEEFMRQAQNRGVDLIVPKIKDLLEYGFRLQPYEN